jgi:hypothetical protein
LRLADALVEDRTAERCPASRLPFFTVPPSKLDSGKGSDASFRDRDGLPPGIDLVEASAVEATILTTVATENELVGDLITLVRKDGRDTILRDRLSDRVSTGRLVPS